MFLLHNFIVSSKAFTFDDEVSQPSHDDPISVAFSRHYLLHSILGLSALQLFAEDRSQLERYRQAISHQDAAIRQAKTHLTHLTVDHAEAMFWFSSFTSLFALAEPPLRPQEGQPRLDPIQDLLHSFRLSRGITTILRRMPDHLGIVKATAPEHWKDNREELIPKLRTNYPQLTQLEIYIRSTCNDFEKASICLSAAEELFTFIAVLQDNPTNKRLTHLIQSWSMNLSDAFVDMCRDKSPAAIAVIGFYVVALETRQSVWFFRGWPSILLKECESILNDFGTDGSKLLEWPKQMVFKP